MKGEKALTQYLRCWRLATGYRRQWPVALAAFCLPLAGTAAAAAEFAPVAPGHALEFPRDHGAHPEFRTEWWYATGWLETPDGKPLGFQVTFFRTRPGHAGANPSAFAAHQVVIGHAALADPGSGRLLHDQRVARAGFGLAQAETGDTRVFIGDWRLAREGGRYRVRIPAREFELALTLEPTQPLLLQGEAGFSQKGPSRASASHYYSLPQLRVSGTLRRGSNATPVQGAAWLDHEWSSHYVDRGAVGWDWIGINLDGGGALMAFRMRDAQGKAFWAGGALRGPDGATRILRRDDIEFRPLRHWRSPRSGAAYPVALALRAGELTLEVAPLMDDQELDARPSTGTIYWEGAVRARAGNREVGRGYLELTGYWKPMRL